MIFFYTHAPCYDGTNILTSLVQLLRAASAAPNDSFGFGTWDVFERMDKEVDISKLGLAFMLTM